MSSVARMPTGERDSTDDAIDVTAALADGGDATPNLESPELAAVLAFPTLGRRPSPEPAAHSLLRDIIGEVLRDERRAQHRTLADVARAASVSLPYLSEVERGRKEISSDLLDAVTDALDITLIDVLERGVGRLRTRMQGSSGIQLRAA